MNTFEEYVRLLRLFLPKDQRDDIIRELSEEHGSRVADQEAGLGRPLSREEHAALIAQYGHPLLLAARYWPQRHLIGPVLYPFYWPVLKVTIGIVILIHAISATVLVASGTPWPDVARIAGQAWYAAIAVFAWVTIAFAVADHRLVRSRILETWNPGSAAGQPMTHTMEAMAHVTRAGEIAGRAIYKHHLKRRGQPSSLARFIAGVVLSVWWLLALKFPHLMFGGGAAVLDWGADMNRLFPVLVVAQVLSLTDHFVGLTRPHDARIVRITRVLWIIAGGFFLYSLFTFDHQWVVWRGAAEARARFNVVAEFAGKQWSLVDLVNLAFSACFIFAASLGVGTIVMKLAQWLFRRGPHAAHV